MLASSFVDDLDDRVLECTVCMKRLQQPKTLPCLHSFCQYCLEDWIKTKKQPTCPTCMNKFEVPNGGLQSIPPNTVLNNLLEYVSHLEDGVVKCSHCKFDAVKYCKDCNLNLCTDCITTHSTVGILTSHSLFSVKYVKGLTPEQICLLKSSHCKNHVTQSLKFYCNTCNVPLCVECIIIEHKKCHAGDKVVNISDTFDEFKKKSSCLIEAGQKYEFEIQEERNKVHKRVTQLEMERSFCEVKIDKSVDKSIRKLEEKRIQLHTSLRAKYNERKKNLQQIADAMDVTSNHFLHMKQVATLSIRSSDPAAALESKNEILEKLRGSVSAYTSTPRLDETQPAVLYFETISPVGDIGRVTHTSKLHEMFELNHECEQLSVTKDQPFNVTLTAPIPDEEKIISAVLSNRSEIEIPVTFIYEQEGIYKSECRCPDTGIWMLRVMVNGFNIEGSPLEIVVEDHGLVHTINNLENFEMMDNKDGKVSDIVVDKDGYLLVARHSREVLKFDQKTGVYVDKIMMPIGCCVYMMSCVEAEDLIIYSDSRNKCVTVCQNDGKTLRSFGKGVIKFAVGVRLDEATRILYVVDRDAHCILKFNFDNGDLLEKMGCEGKALGQFNRPYHIAIRENGIIVTDCRNNRLQFLDKKTNTWRVFVEHIDNNLTLKCPFGVEIDSNGNVVVSSYRNLHMFSADAKFIRRIDSDGDKLDVPCGLALVSEKPRRVGVTNYKANIVNIYNY